MLAALDELYMELDRLDHQLDVARLTLDLAESHDLEIDAPDDLMIRARSLRQLVRDDTVSFRLHQYRSTIIALYGSLERFVETLVSASVARRSDLASNYSDLPKNMRDAHLDLTLELIRRREEPKYQGLVTSADLVARLHSCEQGNPTFGMNNIAFAQHTANFRHQVVCDLLTRACVDPSALDDAWNLTNVMTSRFPSSARYSIIDDLAQRRNEVSHGDMSSSLSLAFLLDYVEVVRAYSRAIASSVLASLADFAISQHGVPLGTPDYVYDNRIACFERARERVNQGSTLAYRRNGRCAVASVLSLQVDKKDRNQTERNEDIGLTTALRCTEGTEIFVLPAASTDLDGSRLDILTPEHDDG